MRPAAGGFGDAPVRGGVGSRPLSPPRGYTGKTSNLKTSGDGEPITSVGSKSNLSLTSWFSDGPNWADLIHLKPGPK
ncbi:unnamed protein product [Caretta caretta]